MRESNRGKYLIAVLFVPESFNRNLILFHHDLTSKKKLALLEVLKIEFLIVIASGRNPGFVSKVKLTPMPEVRLSHGGDRFLFEMKVIPFHVPVKSSQPALWPEVTHRG